MATSAPDVAPLLNRSRGLPVMPPGKNKKTSPVALLLLAVIVLLVLVGIGKTLLKPAENTSTIKVVGAATDLPAGCRLSFTSLHYVEIPQKYMSDRMLTSNEMVVGRITSAFIPVGEPITIDALMPGKETLSSRFAANERAMTLKLDDEALVDHNIYPNDYVDVLCTATKDGKKFTKTLCQQVRVLMATTKDATVGNRTRSGEQSRITLAVTAEQSELLAEAVEIGKLRLVMRSKLSRLPSPSLSGVEEKDVLPGKAFSAVLNQVTRPLANLNPFASYIAPPPPPSALPGPGPDTAGGGSQGSPLQWVVEVFSGAKKDIYAFPQAEK